MLEHNRVICRVTCSNRGEHIRDSSALKQGSLSKLVLEARESSSILTTRLRSSMLEYTGASRAFEHGGPDLEDARAQH